MAADLEARLAEISQMCDAPSSTFSAGEWCHAANDLVAALRVSAAREKELVEALEQAEVDTERKVSVEMRERIEALAAREKALLECDCVPAAVSSKSCQKCGRKATITHERFMEILAREKTLTEALDEQADVILWLAAIDTVPIQHRIEWVASVKARYEIVAADRAALAVSAGSPEGNDGDPGPIKHVIHGRLGADIPVSAGSAAQTEEGTR